MFLFSGFKAVESAAEIFQYSVEEITKAKSEANVQQVAIVGCGGIYNCLIMTGYLH
jgi:fructoselysine-6-P-deglycase FrlB-like protein